MQLPTDSARRRKTAGLAALAVVLFLGGGGAAYALGRPGHSAAPVSPLAAGTSRMPRVKPTHASAPSARASSTQGSSTLGSGATGTTSPPDGTKTLRLGHLVLNVPQAWRVTFSDAQGDYTVSTGACAGDDLIGAEGGSACAAFSMIADAGATDGPAPTTHTYVPGGMYTTSTGATGCPGKPASSWLRLNPSQGKPYYTGYAPVTSTKTADYTVWQFACHRARGGTSPGFYFQQRDWYLPVSRILIVDEYSTPGLAQILATAAWQ